MKLKQIESITSGRLVKQGANHLEDTMISESGGALTVVSLTATDLTAGRIPVVGVGGLLVDYSSLTFDANSRVNAKITLAAGTSSPNGSPIKFTSGTNLTTPEAGTLEYDGTNLYFTPSTTRETLATQTYVQATTIAATKIFNYYNFV